jgi:hypothetical protein
MVWTIWNCFTPTVIVNNMQWKHNPTASREGRYHRLEPDAVKVARPVLRGRGASDIFLLHDRRRRMPVAGFFLLIPVVIVIAIVIRLAAGGMDHDRIKQYAEERGGKVIDSNWSPFGPGWFGEKSDRIYGVRYLDKDGNEHEAHSRTSMWTGVYFTEDRIVKYADRPAGTQVLRLRWKPRTNACARNWSD